MADISHSDLEYKLWVVLWQATHAIARSREKEMRPFGVSVIETAVLFIVQKHEGGITPAELARWLLRKAHTVSGLLQRMEKKGLIAKNRDPAKKNQIRVSLTDKGQKIFLLSTKRQSIHNVLSFLPAENQRQLISDLKTLRDTALRELGLKYEAPFP